MALHSKDEIRSEFFDDLYASSDFSVSMPTYKMPEKEHTRGMPLPWCATN